MPEEDEDLESGFDSLFSMLKPNLASLEILKKIARPSVTPETLRMWIEIAQRPDMAAMIGLSVDNVSREIEKFKLSFELSKSSPEEKENQNKALWLRWYQSYRKRLLRERLKGTTNDERLQCMQNSNPKVILRNHIAQRAIECAEKGDFSEVRNLLQVLLQPYRNTNASLADTPFLKDDNDLTSCHMSKLNESFYYEPAPDWAVDICVT